MRNHIAITFATIFFLLSCSQVQKTEKVAEKKDASPSPIAEVDSRGVIEAGLASHDRALFLHNNWIRDPYIIMGPDDYFYLTGTTPNPKDPREESDPYNIGLRQVSIVGSKVQVWKSKDLIDWEYLGAPYSLEDSYVFGQDSAKAHTKNKKWVLWAPEIHWVKGKWALVHCPGNSSTLAFDEGGQLAGPWTHPMGSTFVKKHDPSLFQDEDGSWYALWGNTFIAKIKEDFSGFEGKPYRIEPASKRPHPEKEGEILTRIGHEGATMRKIGGKYVSFGTAWSTDMGRKGTYNLYYCTSDSIMGTYGPRKFAGRFLGHGTPFQTRDGKWWCTAFFNANVPPVPKEGVVNRDLGETAQTINQRGTTIVPLEVKVLENGEIYIRAKDPAYASPGPEENQEFN